MLPHMHTHTHTQKGSVWQGLQKSGHGECLGEMWFLDVWQDDTHSKLNGTQDSPSVDTTSN